MFDAADDTFSISMCGSNTNGGLQHNLYQITIDNVEMIYGGDEIRDKIERKGEIQKMSCRRLIAAMIERNWLNINHRLYHCRCRRM